MAPRAEFDGERDTQRNPQAHARSRKLLGVREKEPNGKVKANTNVTLKLEEYVRAHFHAGTQSRVPAAARPAPGPPATQPTS